MAGLLPGLSFGPSRKIVEKLTEGVHELTTKPNESVYIVNCSDATLNVNSRCAKVCSFLSRFQKLKFEYIFFPFFETNFNLDLYELK